VKLSLGNARPPSVYGTPECWAGTSRDTRRIHRTPRHPITYIPADEAVQSRNIFPRRDSVVRPTTDGLKFIGSEYFSIVHFLSKYSSRVADEIGLFNKLPTSVAQAIAAPVIVVYKSVETPEFGNYSNTRPGTVGPIFEFEYEINGRPERI